LIVKKTPRLLKVRSFDVIYENGTLQ